MSESTTQPAVSDADLAAIRARFDESATPAALFDPPAVADYRAFLDGKTQLGGESGFKPLWIPDHLYDFQKSLLEYAVRKGRAMLAADCGLGKTPIQFAYADNVVRQTNGRALILAPLAVAAQTVRESEKFGVECRRSGDGRPAGKITVTNYDRLHLFDPSEYEAVICDESSILKNFDGRTRQAVTEFMRKAPYRLLCTATASPNDFVELGSSAEALGELGRMDMLARFFKNDSKTLHLHGTKHGEFTRDRWRFKPHAEREFWRWVCSWARACRKPSDLGFDDGAFVLPPLVTREHVVKTATPPPGELFARPAETLPEQREEARRTLAERCDAVVALTAGTGRPAVAWCHLNAESDRLAASIPGAVQVCGADADEAKEEKFLAFAAGQIRVLVTKPTIGGFGLNWQHCAHQTFFPSHSFEQFYQCVRRSWRFGQRNPVTVDVVATEGEAGVLANLKRKSDQADRMFGQLVSLMNRHTRIARTAYGETQEEIPSWL